LTDVGDSHGALVRTAAVVHLLRGGATLILNNVHEIFETIGAISTSLAQTFRAPVWANLYLSCRRERGFDLHWDMHDTLITQVYGRKHWQVFAPTRLHPVEKPRSSAFDHRSVAPLLDDLLSGGETLYLPRGWWHVATPIDEPSLHITFGIKHPTGIDLMRRLVFAMADYEEARADLPLHAPAEVRVERVRRLTRLFTDLCMNGDQIEAHYQELARADAARPDLGLPSSISGHAETNHTTIILLAEKRELELSDYGDDGMSFAVDDRVWRVRKEYAAPLKRLDRVTGTSLGELLGMVAPGVRPGLSALLTVMLTDGVLVTRPASSVSTS